MRSRWRSHAGATASHVCRASSDSRTGATAAQYRPPWWYDAQDARAPPRPVRSAATEPGNSGDRAAGRRGIGVERMNGEGLAGFSALVTGGGSGIGLACAARLAADGAAVTIIG